MATENSFQSLNPSTSSLIMVDMQNDFAHPEGYYTRVGLPVPDFDPTAARDAIPSMQKLLIAARQSGMFVVHTRIERESFLAAPSRPRRIVPDSFSSRSDQQRPLVSDTWGAQTIDELSPAEGEYVLQKYNYSAFYGTPLEKVLRRQGIDTVVIAGTVTYACVLHTAFDAYVRDFDVVVASDGVASWVPELQKPAQRIVELLLGSVQPVDEIVASLDRDTATSALSR